MDALVPNQSSKRGIPLTELIHNLIQINSQGTASDCSAHLSLLCEQEVASRGSEKRLLGYSTNCEGPLKGLQAKGLPKYWDAVTSKSKITWQVTVNR